MNDIPSLITELVRGANTVAVLSDVQRAHLLNRAYNAVRDSRDKIGIKRVGSDRDPAIDILMMSRSVGIFSDEQIIAALLEAAGLLRDLRIAIGRKNGMVPDGRTR